MLRMLALARCCSQVHHTRSFNTAAYHYDQPLRILFCGSDDFSVASLRALHKYSQEADGHILSIDVAAKTDKPSGRGLRKLKAPLIKSVAEELRLPLHQFNTFTGWSPPEFPNSNVPFINLIVAVSFGLLIPARIIKGSAFGGLNVHPSLLPDLKGAAPLNWAIIRGYTLTGVSIQTLHPTHFDEGLVLAQTDAIPLSDDMNVNQLREAVSPIGADLLVQTIKNRRYLQSYPSPKAVESTKISLAPKITSAHRLLGHMSDDLPTILRKNRAIPRLFAYALAQKDHSEPNYVRILVGTSMKEVASSKLPSEVLAKVAIGKPFGLTTTADEHITSSDPVYVLCKDGRVLEIPLLLVEGAKEGPALQVAASRGLLQPAITIGQHGVHQFRGLKLSGP